METLLINALFIIIRRGIATGVYTGGCHISGTICFETHHWLVRDRRSPLALDVGVFTTHMASSRGHSPRVGLEARDELDEKLLLPLLTDYGSFACMPWHHLFAM